MWAIPTAISASACSRSSSSISSLIESSLPDSSTTVSCSRLLGWTEAAVDAVAVAVTTGCINVAAPFVLPPKVCMPTCSPISSPNWLRLASYMARSASSSSCATRSNSASSSSCVKLTASSPEGSKFFTLFACASKIMYVSASSSSNGPSSPSRCPCPVVLPDAREVARCVPAWRIISSNHSFILLFMGALGWGLVLAPDEASASNSTSKANESCTHDKTFAMVNW